MRRLIEFVCEGETLVGTLDEARHDGVGLLIVSGGNEIRCGAHRGMALLARRLAAAGVPVFRFDRRGIGDSSGTNGSFDSSGPDLAAATAAFRAEAGIRAVVAFGNCDAASALALFHVQAGIDTIILSNPWPGETIGDMPPPAAIRARYVERLRDPRQWLRLMRGQVRIGRLIQGLSTIATSSARSPLIDRMAVAMHASRVPSTILIATRDNTAIAFADEWSKCANAPDVPIQRRDTASHSYAAKGDLDWLYDRLHEVTRYSAA